LELVQEMDGCVVMSIGWHAQDGVCLGQFDVDAVMEHPSSEEAVSGCIGCWTLELGLELVQEMDGCVVLSIGWRAQDGVC